jgi:hypothetical protein
MRKPIQTNEIANLYGELLRSKFGLLPKGEHHIRRIYAMVKEKFSDMCDDTYLCRDHCSSHDPGPEWKHRVRSALNDLKKRNDPSIRKGPGRGLWVKA